MRPNRKADLQRKLTLAAIPTPPAGLAQRIKTDIPKHFPDSTAERKRLGSAVAFNMRVAASILLLVGSLFVALYILNRAYLDEDQHMRDFSHSLESNKAPSAAASPVPKLPQSASKVVTSTEEPPVTVAPPEPRGRRAEAEIAETKAKKSERQLVDAETRRDREKDEAAKSPAKELADLDKKRDDFGRAVPAAPVSVPTPAPPPPPSAAAEESATVVVAQAPAVSVGRNAGGVNVTSTTATAAPQKAASELAARKSAPAGSVQSARASDLVVARAQMKKIPNDPVTPLVQHFAGPIERPRHGVRLEADAAPSPLDSTKGVLRISIDTAGNPGAGASAAPAAAGARLEIAINTRAVESHRAVTGEPSTGDGTLDEGLSTTAVYEFQLVPNVSGQTVLATVRLHYRSMPDGREQTLERTVRVSDIATSWAAASQRTKNASLAAAFAETQVRGGDTSAIAEKARAIGLDELAALAKPR